MHVYINLFILGLTLSFGPCLFFCTPILIPYIAATKIGWKNGLKNVIIFSLSKTVAYLFLGILAGFLGSRMQEIIYGKREIIHILGGIFISFLGIIIIFSGGSRNSFCVKCYKRLVSHKSLGTILLGLIVGFLPCLPLLGVVTFIALSSKNILDGFICASFFSIGVFISPLLFLGPLASVVSGIIVKNKILSLVFTRLCGILLILMGVYIALL